MAADTGEVERILGALDSSEEEEADVELLSSRSDGWRPSRRTLLWTAVGLACALGTLVKLQQPRTSLRAGVAATGDATGLAEEVEATPAESSTGRKGSFLVIGDWGFDNFLHGNIKNVTCQETIARAMLKTMHELGDVKFIINVGDSFYPGGVWGKGDPQWDTKWRNVFHPDLRSVPWYSVYGNHDFHKDPCACSPNPLECAQVNGNIDNLDFFYMPSPNWHKEHPELDLEVVALDFNQVMWAWDKQKPIDGRCATDCFWTKCQEQCEDNYISRAKYALGLLNDRLKKSTTKNLVVFSHYPTDYLWALPGVMAGLSNASVRHVEYFGGHRHNVDQASTASTYPNSNWLVGGGGGWSCDAVHGEKPKQGFLVGEIGLDGKLTTRPVLVDHEICCPEFLPPKPPPGGWPPPKGPQPFCARPIWDPDGMYSSAAAEI